MTFPDSQPRTAFVFPGQGSHAVGMGRDLYEGSPAARLVFQEIDDALGRPLSKTMFEGPEDVLVRTSNAQPAISAVSLACWKAMEEVGGRTPSPAMVAGHSLGEYTALAVSGVLGIADTARLVVKRGKLMQAACDDRPGGMAALIGIDELAVEDVCRQTGAYIANINNSQQIVISGDHMSLARAIDLAAARGARKCVPLSVGGAFHSDLMKPARSGLLEFLETLHFNDPVVPIIGNVDARPLATGAAVRQELAAQMLSCVQWQRSVTYMIANGIDRFIELGPGRVLTGLIRRIDSSAAVGNASDLPSVRALAA